MGAKRKVRKKAVAQRRVVQRAGLKRGDKRGVETRSALIEKVVQARSKFKEARKAYEIPLDLIKVPREAQRTTMDEEKLHALARSIKAKGVEQPISVVPDGKGYEIVFGHRRFLASKLCGKMTIPAFIDATSPEEVWSVKYHENAFREDPSIPDEALYLAKMIEVNKWTQEAAARAIGRTIGYISQRLSVLEWDEPFLDALKGGEVSYAALRELAAIDDREIRWFYLKQARESGLTSTMAVQWRREAGRLAAQEAKEPGSVEKLMTPAGVAEVRLPCGICQKKTNTLELKYVGLCSNCLAEIQDGGK